MPKKYNTPNVYETEIDISEITTPAGTSTGAITAPFPKGPVNRPVLVTSDKQFVEKFGEPAVSGSDLIYGYGAYAALEFLKESDALYVVRAAVASEDFFAANGISTEVTATTIAAIGASAGPVPDKADLIYAIDNTVMPATTDMIVGAISPGDWGNDIAITVESLTSASDWLFQYDDLPVGVSPSAVETSAMTIARRVFKVSVFTKSSSDSWTDFKVDKVGTSALSIVPIESFYGTLRVQLDGNNQQLFIKDVINGNSNYIYVDVNSNATVFEQTYNPIVKTSANEVLGIDERALISLTGGVAVPKTGLGTYYSQWEYLTDKQNYDINIVIIPDYSTTVKQQVVQNVVGSRKDCIAVAQVGSYANNTLESVLNAEKYGYTDPSYIALYAGWDKVYDKYNSRNVFLPKSIFGAALMARTDDVANVWDAPAGMSRGIIPSSEQNKLFDFSEIGQLYDRNINTSRLIRGVGHVMWGQKTAQMKKSALDRINVRRLLLFIRKSMEEALLPYVLDVNNTAKTRLRIWSNLDAFLATIQAEGGLLKYEVVCNESNNPAQVIDSNQLNVDVYVQPVKTVEFISLQTIVTKTGVNFEEVRVR